MIEVTYDRLNELVHEVADLVEDMAAIPKLDRSELNDVLSSYLASKQVVFVDELDDNDERMEIAGAIEEPVGTVTSDADPGL